MDVSAKQLKEESFFVYCVIKRIVDHGPDVTFMQERVCDCDYRKRDEQKVHVNSFLQVSCTSNEIVVQQERSNCIVSSIRSSVRFD